MAGAIVHDALKGTDRYVEILFTSSGTADEFEVTGLPDLYTIVRLDAVLESGTGATVDPAVGLSTGFSAGDFDEKGSDIDGAPAARVSTASPNPIRGKAGNSLFVQPRVDAFADNVIRVGLYIREGWAE